MERCVCVCVCVCVHVCACACVRVVGIIKRCVYMCARVCVCAPAHYVNCNTPVHILFRSNYHRLPTLL